ncbi:MAG: hypothetical protein HQL80_11555 [Magnetococcales bacterium]|nr:hypothetical protein [Magnetococcales bacterium]
MANQPVKIPQDLMIWIEARKRFRLSHVQIQMARELGLNPRKFGGLDNNRQEPWKKPLPQFIEDIYFKRFKKTKPDQVRTVEEVAAARQKKAIAKPPGELSCHTPPVETPLVGDDALVTTQQENGAE